jgi:hypothetical protein
MPNRFLLAGIALACAGLLLMDARRSMQTGEFRFGMALGLLLEPISRLHRPRFYWTMVICYGVAMLLGVAVAAVFVLAQNSN